MKTYTPQEVFEIIEKIEELTNPFVQNNEKDVNRLTLTQARQECGVPESTYRGWLKDPIYFDYLRELQMMKSFLTNHESKAVLMDAINGNKKIPEMERIKLAQNFLKNTDREHNIAITQLNEGEKKKIEKPSVLLNKLADKLLELDTRKNDTNDAE